MDSFTSKRPPYGSIPFSNNFCRFSSRGLLKSFVGSMHRQDNRWLRAGQRKFFVHALGKPSPWGGVYGSLRYTEWHDTEDSMCSAHAGSDAIAGAGLWRTSSCGLRERDPGPGPGVRARRSEEHTSEL